MKRVLCLLIILTFWINCGGGNPTSPTPPSPNQPSVPVPPKIIEFKATSSTINAGDWVTFSCWVDYVTQIKIEPHFGVIWNAPHEAAEINVLLAVSTQPPETTLYTLTAINANNGGQATAKVTVTVNK